MNKKLLSLALFAVASLSQAAVLLQINPTDPGAPNLSNTDLNAPAGRLFRDAVGSLWGAPKAFPGVGASPNRVYDLYTFNVSTVAPSYSGAVYWNILQDDPSNTGILVAYAGSFNPANLGTNYLGDPGSSGNDGFGFPRNFQVELAASTDLVLVFQRVAASTASFSDPNYGLTVEAYSSPNYDEFDTTGGEVIPEPSTYVLTGVGVLAVWLRSRRR